MLKKLVHNIFHFFPIQIFLNYLKNNQILLIFWILLFGFINGVFGQKYGIDALFLVPEYLHNSNYLSFLFYGFSFGIFITAFHLSAYIVSGYKFPFVVTLARPFIKFSINNSILPLLFIINFLIQSYSFQIHNELFSISTIIINLSSFLIGNIIFFLIPFSYFFSTNKILRWIFGTIDKNIANKQIAKPIKKVLEKDKEWKIRNAQNDEKTRWRVESYFSLPFKISKSRRVAHYSEAYIQKVLHQNHYNATFFSMVILTLIIFFGFTMDNELLILPAATSILLIFTQFLFIYSIIHSLFKEWSFVMVIILFFGINKLSENKIIGSDNIISSLIYNNSNLDLDSYKLEQQIKDHNNEILNLINWKKNTGKEKPKMIFINSAGGGLKMSIWAYYSLGVLDSVTNKQITKQIRLFSGASGGMIGNAYYREIYRQRLSDTTINILEDAKLKSLSQDILNPVLQSLSYRDWFVNINPFIKNKENTMDRAYEFEKYLNKNTLGHLNKSIGFYKQYEETAQIPALIISPSIVNTGQTMFISPLDISYMVTPSYTGLSSKENNSIEFRKVYKKFNADSLNLLSALRMNASFPYISPIITMPGTPKYKLADAAYLDNYGFFTSLKYLKNFKQWIKENTSGVIFIQLIEEDVVAQQTNSIAFDIVEPFTSSFSNMFNIQLYNSNKIIDAIKEVFGNNFDFINITLKQYDKPIPLSWHLTTKDKEKIYNSINTKENQKNLLRIKKLIK